MKKSIFTDNFPLIKTDEELEAVKLLYPQFDPYYIASGCIKERKEKFDKMWEVFSLYADSNFLSDIKKHFHERTWEMYLGYVFAKKGKLTIIHRDKGPDFQLNDNLGRETFIEAVTCQKGTTSDAVPEMFVAKSIKDVRVVDVPHDEMLLRLSSALAIKSKKYKDFINNKKSPYIIAINKGALEHPDPQIPLILKCLFGLGCEHFKKVEGVLKYNGWTRMEYIEKKNGEKISMTFFENEENNFISAIIYSPESVLSSPENIGTDCVLVHNPKALFPLNEKDFSFLEQWKAEYTGSSLEVKKVNKI